MAIDRQSCRACGSSNIFVGIDIGKQPIAGAFLKNKDDRYETFDTKMLICKSCGLGQINQDIDPDKLYSTYNWRTSTSISYLEYIWDFADNYIVPSIKPGEWVLEIASNDGYLLKYLQSQGVDVLGVDPAKNISTYAIASGVPVIVDFFDAKVATKILEIKGSPKWIIANNVMAHTPTLNSFMEGIAILTDEYTTVTIENPTIMNILDHQHFDVIFHEHYSYLSANAVFKLSEKYGLTLTEIQSTPPQGGSNRYWLRRGGIQSEGVDRAIREEVMFGLLDEGEWQREYRMLKQDIEAFHNKVEKIWKSGGTICGMGASAKSTVLLNFAKIKPSRILAIADDVKEKQGHYMPGTLSEIIDTESMLKLDPTDIIIFAWNIFDELEERLRTLGYTGNIWKWNG